MSEDQRPSLSDIRDVYELTMEMIRRDIAGTLPPEAKSHISGAAAKLMAMIPSMVAMLEAGMAACDLEAIALMISDVSNGAHSDEVARAIMAYLKARLRWLAMMLQVRP
jgi:hypothetical protein